MDKKNNISVRKKRLLGRLVASFQGLSSFQSLAEWKSGREAGINYSMRDVEGRKIVNLQLYN